MTRSKKGSYYRLKTKKWLEAKGFAVRNAEQIRRVQNKKTGQIIHVKEDTFGADLIAIDGKQALFVNSICNRSDINSHIKKFLKYPYPPCIDRWVVLWTPGQHAKRGQHAEPEIFDVNEVKEIEED